MISEKLLDGLKKVGFVSAANVEIETDSESTNITLVVFIDYHKCKDGYLDLLHKFIYLNCKYPFRFESIEDYPS